MLAKTYSGAVVGLDGILINVEVDITKKGFGAFKIVGLASKAVDESRDRVRTAIENSGLEFTKYRLTVNLAPADLPKEGPTYDLPIAVAILGASEIIDSQAIEKDSIFIGELSLDGSLNSTPAVLPLTLLAARQSIKKIYLPAVNAKEASLVPGIEIYPVENLKQLILHLNGTSPITPVQSFSPEVNLLNTYTADMNFEDVRGQDLAKRALIVAAAGGHNILLSGPPGAGKTLMARILPTILTPLTWDEALTVTKIHSIIKLVDPNDPLITTRPFRSPHHSTSRVGLIGGSSQLTPGEISLAHHGVLFLDEMAEFPRSVLESLRQPLEDGFVTISRAKGTVKFPASFMLVAATNPCPCGWYGSSKKRCTCSPTKLYAYQQRLSGPLLDRIDIHTTVQEVNPLDIIQQNKNEGSDIDYKETLGARELIKKARETQIARFQNSVIHTNAEMNARMIQKYCQLSDDLNEVLATAGNRLNLSARALHKILKVARTIADLDQSDGIKENHLHEAINYRKK